MSKQFGIIGSGSWATALKELRFVRLQGFGGKEG